MTNCCLDPGDEGGGGLSVLEAVANRDAGGGERAGCGTGGGLARFGDWTRGKGPMGCWVTRLSCEATVSFMGESGAVGRRGGAVKHSPNSESEEDLLARSRRLFRLSTPGGGGGL